MQKYKCITVAILICCNLQVKSQKRGYVWTFGHHAAIDFNVGAPVNDTYAVISRGSCASICDTVGPLLFYSSYDDDVYNIGGPPFSNGEIFNSQHQTMQNGDSIVMGLWYYELVVIDNPLNQNQYYVFSIGVTGNYGIYYSLVDMSLNDGLGAVIQKNIQLQNFKQVDCLTAIKHGNGRDWWILFRKK